MLFFLENLLKSNESLKFMSQKKHSNLVLVKMSQHKLFLNILYQNVDYQVFAYK